MDCKWCELEEEHKITVRMHRRIRCAASSCRLRVAMIDVLLWLHLRMKELKDQLQTAYCSCSAWADSDVDAFSDLSDDSS